jgi:AcrR family transcriptional regulator
METKQAVNRIGERKLRDRQARRAQIISAARHIAEAEGWPSVTVRRLSDEISYSQPVLYAHFGSREGILAAIAIEGFGEMGLALEKARKRGKRGSTVEAVAMTTIIGLVFPLTITLSRMKFALPCRIHPVSSSPPPCWR